MNNPEQPASTDPATRKVIEPDDRARRWTLLAGAGAVALAAGAAWRLWGPRGTAETAGSGGLEVNLNDVLWSLTVPNPRGEALLLAQFKGRPLLLNFWASWCAPCVREMPALEQFHQAWRGQGWQVLGLAIDGPTAVRDFLGRVQVSFPIGLAGLEGTALLRKLGNLQGGLPFTVLISAQGAVIQRKLGEITPDELRAWAENHKPGGLQG
jgi:thiol-disulfide isomerase/thioredoxin